MNENYIEYALLFKALSDANRLLIIDYLLDGELCACKILEKLQITQSTLSYHMKILSDSNIVTVEKEGKWMHYTLNTAKFEEMKGILNNFTNANSCSVPICSC
jgi:ArsR family transcriptional regulator